MSTTDRHQFDEDEAQRVDAFLAGLYPDRSRSSIAKLIKKGEILVDGGKVKPSTNLKGGETVEITFPPEPSPVPLAEDIDLDVLYEDDDIIVINKPAGMVVHPGCGHRDGTLVNALLHAADQLSDVAEPQRMGIVHRLDKDTSGVILAAKTDRGHLHVAQQFKDREVHKEYLAITEGVPVPNEGEIDLPLGRNPRNRKKMAVRQDRGKKSFTRYKVEEDWGDFALIRCFPKTGRTHQIRVHLQSLGHPILCDPFYGRRKQLQAHQVVSRSSGVVLERLALHAHRLEIGLFGKKLKFEAPLPDDIDKAVHFFRTSM